MSLYFGNTDITLGLQGQPGKSAFAYAQENGYLKTEAEFGQELASIPQKTSELLNDSNFITVDAVTQITDTKVDEEDLENYYTKTEVEAFHDSLEDYVDQQVANLVNAAPETLDTLGELATAFEENKEVVEALDASITNKQDKISDTLILVDTITGLQHKIQIQNGQLVSFPVE